MSFDQPAFPIERIRLFSADGHIYRAFNHMVAARVGALLCVPFHLVLGRCDAVLDGCPVPWEEVAAVLDDTLTDPFGPGIPSTINTHGIENIVEVIDHAQQLKYLGIDPLQCALDFIHPMGTSKVMRLVHPCGLRYAVVV